MFSDSDGDLYFMNNGTKWYAAHAKDVTAANTGGIVAQSLGANGYVKFANGLIIQWGTFTKQLSQNYIQFSQPLTTTRHLYIGTIAQYSQNVHIGVVFDNYISITIRDYNNVDIPANTTEEIVWVFMICY